MIQPLETTDDIRQAYLRYLQSSYPFQRKDLREKFRKAISKPNTLVKGPLLESTPPFQTGKSIEGLVNEGVLHSSFEELCSTALPYDRPLYIHQEEAIRKITSGDRNIVVATGTGSGKTEAFLIPLLNHLLHEQGAERLSKPGVRALLLYPMNALVNDQLKRLRSILEDSPFPITFGRYTGETAYEREKAVEDFKAQFRGEPIIDNELLCRNEMRVNPPQILVTNYAMLEYLLLRPEDHIFFANDEDTWRFLVLDEAHTYDGTTGIELGMLIRRLKERVHASSLSCVATSATIGGGEEDFPEIVHFARNLFGEPFKWEADGSSQQDVVAATRRSADNTASSWGKGTPAFYKELHSALQKAEGLAETFGEEEDDLGIDESEWVSGNSGSTTGSSNTPVEVLAVAARKNLSEKLVDAALHDAESGSNASIRIGKFLHELLSGDERLEDLKKELAERPFDVREIASLVFPESGDANEALVHLVSIAVRAKQNRNKPPLLPARYHVFAKALEGAFACLNTAGHEDEKAWLSLKRRERCPTCDGDVQELASCKFCGATYLVAQKIKSRQLCKGVFC